MYSITALLKEAIFCSFVLCGISLAALGQDIVDPAARPAVFLQEGVATPNNESVATFMPDGKTVFFADGQTICFSKLNNGKWGKPATASFSGHWKDWDPALRPDGKRLIFVSTRPLENMQQDTPRKKAHLWYVDHLTGDQWSAPKHFDAPVNEEQFNDFGPSISSQGSICFCSRGRDGTKGMRGYYLKWQGDHYDQPKMLTLNGDGEIYDPFIAPDESYILFASNGDLYISYRNGEGWAQGQKLGPQVNNGNGNGDPFVSPDGKMLYYSQDKAPGILMIPVKIPAAK